MAIKEFFAKLVNFRPENKSNWTRATAELNQEERRHIMAQAKAEADQLRDKEEKKEEKIEFKQAA